MNTQKTKQTNRIVSLLIAAAVASSLTGLLSVAAESSESSITGTVKAHGANTPTVAVIVTEKGGSDTVYSSISENGEINIPQLSKGEYTVTFGKTYYASREYDVTVEDEVVEINAEINRYGDLNGDGEITTADVAIVNSHAKSVRILEDYEFKLGDVNLDGTITTADCGMINSHAKGLKKLQVVDPNSDTLTEPTEPSKPDDPFVEPTEPTTEPDTTIEVGTQPYKTGEIGYTGHQWIEDTLTGKTTLEKIELINEKTIELMELFPRQELSKNSIGRYYDLGEDLSCTLATIDDSTLYNNLIGNELITSSQTQLDMIKWIWTYGNNPTWTVIWAPGTQIEWTETVSPDEYLRDAVHGRTSWNYGLIFASICKEAGITLYAEQQSHSLKAISSDAQVFMVVENGVKYYTCPVLNAYYKLGKYGAGDINTYTNVTDVEELNNQLTAFYDYRESIYVGTKEENAFKSGFGDEMYRVYCGRQSTVDTDAIVELVQ